MSMQFSEALVYPLSRPQTKVEQYFRLLYGQFMREIPRQRVRRKKPVGSSVMQENPFSYDQERPYVYVGSKRQMKAAATFMTLFNILFDESFDTTYYTPNGFYRNDGRRAENARWINALAVDIDPEPHEVVTVAEIFDRCEDAGLPRPTLIVRTPSGGFHVTWIFNHGIQPVRATPKTVRLFEAIQRHVSNELGGDPNAIGVERIFRTPTEESICFFNPVTYDFQYFIDWRNINHPYVPVFARPSFENYNLMDEPAIRELYNQEAGFKTRDISCLTLTLAMKFSGYSLDKALTEIEEWWNECCVKGSNDGKKPFSLKDALEKVKYVYKRARYHGPSVEDVEKLTGMSFSYRYTRYRFFTPRKPREERKRVHNAEWKEDLLNLLKREKSLAGAMSALAQRLGCAVSTFKVVLNELVREGVISVQTKRGRTGSTTIDLLEDGQHADVSDRFQNSDPVDNSTKEKNSQSNNTGVTVVGGASPAVGSAEALISSLSLLNGPYPSSLPLYLHDVYLSEVTVWFTQPGLDSAFASQAALHTYAVLKKTLFGCLRSTKRSDVKNLTAYVRHAFQDALLTLKDQGYSVDAIPASFFHSLKNEGD
ncbi:hypothetical protein ABEX29_01130 [Brevibacillus porteri]|uniref:hypothetical protein n=1 Tax=Brevibacillus porteri TaxID=2126350 RepID=UPI003D229083